MRALRVTYVGELGWELHMPLDSLASVYDALMKAGGPHGIRNAGYRAIESLRLEKFYRAWSSDISPDHSPLEAGMGWAVKLKKNVPFLGREALTKQAMKKLPKLLACFTVDDPSIVLLGRETIFRNGKQCGWLASGGYGYTLETNIGIGYVRDKENGVVAGGRALRHLRAGDRLPALSGQGQPGAALRSEDGAGEGVAASLLPSVMAGRDPAIQVWSERTSVPGSPGLSRCAPCPVMTEWGTSTRDL